MRRYGTDVAKVGGGTGRSGSLHNVRCETGSIAWQIDMPSTIPISRSQASALCLTESWSCETNIYTRSTRQAVLDQLSITLEIARPSTYRGTIATRVFGRARLSELKTDSIGRSKESRSPRRRIFVIRANKEPL